jgi:hypothetical protein
MAGVDDAVVAYARELYEADKVFAQIDYRWFAARPGRADCSARGCRRDCWSRSLSPGESQ